MERKSIPAGYISPGNSPFLRRLPREVRDKIYDKLLIVQRTTDDQDKYDKIQAGLAGGTHEYELERELDFLSQDYLLILDLSRANKGMQFIGKNKGILLANKQIYDEATTTLFGKNVFGAFPQSERIEAFWRCGRGSSCYPLSRPCQLRYSNLPCPSPISANILLSDQKPSPKSSTSTLSSPSVSQIVSSPTAASLFRTSSQICRRSSIP